MARPSWLVPAAPAVVVVTLLSAAPGAAASLPSRPGAGSVLTSGGAGAAQAADPCSYTFTSGRRTVTVRCSTEPVSTQFRADAKCPNGTSDYGPWVDQGPGHVSVASCTSPMVQWFYNVR